MPKEYVAIGLLALAGFLGGGVYSTWKNARGLAIVLLVLTLVALAAAITWYL
jgi:hypothetical protein